jgi:L-ascorbate metabolism protein UlaG (beta-lactamase superfamily)
MPIYTNLDGTTPDKNLVDIFKWQVVDRLAGKKRKAAGRFETPRVENDGKALTAAGAHATWVGHATFLVRLGGQLIATDPIWSSRIQGAVPRNVAPGVRLEDAPKIDVVTISHAHFDHFDLPSLKRIGKDALYIVPKDNADLLTSAGLPNVVELSWWETHRVGDLKVTLVPSQHWSMRFPWDRNRRLWGGFVLEGPEGVAYHAGDTAMKEDVFRSIKERVAPIDWAMLPIGAYDPKWFMQPQHMGPEEAVHAYELLGAKHFLAMHWGTFKLTDEPLGEPPQLLRQRWTERALDPDRLFIFDIGQTLSLR